jgi:hypothetical protein
MIQYETTVGEQRIPVLRYDTAHGYAHRDQMFRRREPIKTRLDDRLSLDEALQFADNDVRHRWRIYRRQFMRDQP